MTALTLDGYDWIPAGASSATIFQLLQASSYFLRGGDSGSTPALSVATGRFGFGQKLVYSAFLQRFGAMFKNVRVVGDGSVQSSEGFVGMAINIGSANQTPFYVGFYDAVTNHSQVTVSLDANGVARVYRGDWTDGVLLVTSKAGCWQASEDFYLEFGGLVDNVAGTFEVRVNTVPIVSLLSADTQFTAVAGFDSLVFGAYSFSNFGQTVTASVDDLYCCNAAGTKNNTYLGNVRIKTQFTVAPGDLTNFSIAGSALTNWQAVHNTALTDAGGYVYSPTIAAQDLYALDPILTSAPVLAVQVRAGVRQDDATQRIYRNVLKMGGVEVEGIDHYTNQTFTYYADIFEVDPSTGLGMTGTDVNAAQAGPKVEG